VIDESLPNPEVTVDVVVPFDRGELTSALHEHARVIDTDYDSHGTRIRAEAPAWLAAKLTEYEVHTDQPDRPSESTESDESSDLDEATG
jgi:GTP-binding protein HflX